MSSIYLDYAATTPVDPRVASVMAAHLTAEGTFANPSSTHAPGLQARDAVARARVQLARAIGADPAEIVWTSGATEAINLALQGVMARHGGRGHIVTCSSEHPATLDACRALERAGASLSCLAPERDGRLPVARVAAAIRPDTRLVSLMHVNNETGVVHDLAAVAELVQATAALLHVDAAQSLGKLAIDVRAMRIDLLSCTAHKLYGPKGIGALFIASGRDIELTPLTHGGGQEWGLRPGTLPTHQIVGMGEAAQLACANLAAEDRRIRDLREQLWLGLAALGGVHRNGAAEPSVAGILNVSFEGIAAEDLMFELDGIAVSAGSACAATSQHASPVLTAMGLDSARIDGALRLSLGRYTTAQEIDTVVDACRRAVGRLRAGTTAG